MKYVNPKKYDHIMWKVLKEAQVGDWAIKKQWITTDRHLRSWDEKEGMFMGQFTQPYPSVALVQDGQVWMSDTPFEQETHEPMLREAKGSCLTSGLGLGYAAVKLAIKPQVTKVTVVEKSKDVIALVGTQIERFGMSVNKPATYADTSDSKFNIIQGDIWDYLATTDQKFDTVHIDIWPTLISAMMEADRAKEAAKRVLSFNGNVFVWMAEHRNLIGGLPDKPMRSNGFNAYDPCKGCGKTLRHDFGGFCMDCADEMGMSELFIERQF